VRETDSYLGSAENTRKSVDYTGICCRERVGVSFLLLYCILNKSHFGGIMNKAELVTKMAEGAELTKAQAEKALNCFIAVTTAALKDGDKIALVGFGTFSAVNRAARIGRNPQTGKEIKIAAKTNGKFTPGKALKDLNPKPGKAAPKAKTKAKK
jgi:DNA-binding protein HU-beta